MIDLCGSAPREVTCGELEERLNRVANLMGTMGLKPGDRLAMCINNRFEFIEVMYGAMHAGVVPVPLDARLDTEILEFTVCDYECVAALVEPASASTSTTMMSFGASSGREVRSNLRPQPAGA
ncbi:MAG: AMP-binding protein [Rhodospirillales bacterium]|nr:AMP-binding protein [Rhodospirillales bacterium]